MTTQIQESKNIAPMKNIEELYQSTLNSKTPAWLKDLKQTALDRFQKVGIPTTKDEDWKYTNLTPVFKQNYQLQTDENLKNLSEIKKYLSG